MIDTPATGTQIPANDGYTPSASALTPEAAQARLDEVWTKTAGILNVSGVYFLLRSEVSAKHVLVDTPAYRVVVPHPTHASLERAVWPSLGQSVSRDAGVGVLPVPHAVLPISTPHVLEWTKDHVVIAARLCMFRVDRGSRIVVAQEVPK